jgi:hypothetical protein
MRKLAVLPVALVAAAATAAPALAQVPETTFSARVDVTPKKAGTKKKPQSHQLTGSLEFKTITQGVEPPIVTGGEFMIPKHGLWGGGKYKTCSGAKMRKAQSTDVCPKESIIGSGSGVAFADNVDAAPDVVFVNGGKNTAWAFTTLYNPALVQEPIQIKIAKASGKWAYKVSFKVPEVLQIVAGVPVTLRNFKFTIGGKFKLPGSSKTIDARKYAPLLVASDGCPKNKILPYEATAHYLYNTGQTASKKYKGGFDCKNARAIMP